MTYNIDSKITYNKLVKSQSLLNGKDSVTITPISVLRDTGMVTEHLHGPYKFIFQSKDECKASEQLYLHSMTSACFKSTSI